MISSGVLTYASIVEQIGDFERTDSFSIECWVYPTSGKINEDIISKFTYAIGYRFVSHSTRGKVNGLEVGLYSNESNKAVVVISGALGLPINTWQHYVVTYNGSSSTSGIKIYVNGTSRALLVAANNLTNTIKTIEPFKIGTGYYPFYGGKIDEVCIYSRVLSASEVTQRYNAGVGTENLFGSSYAHYLLNESSGSSVSDSSGNGRNLSTIGNPSWVVGKLNNCVQLNGSSQYITG